MPLNLQINLGHSFVHGLMLLLPTVALALESAFEAAYSEVIALGLPGMVVYALCHIPAGWLGDRISRGRLLQVCLLGLGASAVAAGFAIGPLSLAAALCGVGAFAALYHPIALPLLAADGRRLGLRLAINGVFGSLGVAGAPLLAGTLAAGFDWRAAFVLPGLACILLGLLPQSKRGGGAEGPAPSATAGPDSESIVGPAAGPRSRSRLLAWMTALATSVIVAGFCYDGLAIALPKALQLQGGALAESIVLAGLGSSLILAAAGVLQLFLGSLSDRISTLPVYFGLLALRGALLLLAAQSGGALFVAAVLGSVALTFADYPLQDKLLAMTTPDHLRSRAFAAKQIIGALVALAVVPLVAGTAETGFFGLFLVLGALTLLNLAVFAALAARMRRHDDASILR